jgi:hypothetical protein
MKNTIRGILIDPQAKQLSYVDVELNERGSCLKGLYKAINCDLVELVRLSDSLDLWVDEERLLKIEDDTRFFYVDGLSSPIAGRGVILGSMATKHGIESVACPSTIDDVRNQFVFSDFFPYLP